MERELGEERLDKKHRSNFFDHFLAEQPKPNKTKKIRSMERDPGEERLDSRHRSEYFIFAHFFCRASKTKKQKQILTHGEVFRTGEARQET